MDTGKISVSKEVELEDDNPCFFERLLHFLLLNSQIKFLSTGESSTLQSIAMRVSIHYLQAVRVLHHGLQWTLHEVCVK